MLGETDKNNPKQPAVVRDVQIYNIETREWEKGFLNNIEMLPKEYECEWTNCSTTNKAPDGKDLIIDVERASKIAIQVDSTPADSDATSIDINVMASLDGAKWDTIPYAEMNFGDAQIKTFLVNPAPMKIRFRLDYNAGTSRADVKLICKVRE